jgi:hypothetical protein
MAYEPPPRIEIKISPKPGYGYYWHLVDGRGTVRCWSGQGFDTDAEAQVDADIAVALIRDPRLVIVPAM